jgi:hypothetical protein
VLPGPALPPAACATALHQVAAAAAAAVVVVLAVVAAAAQGTHYLRWVHTPAAVLSQSAWPSYRASPTPSSYSPPPSCCMLPPAPQPLLLPQQVVCLGVALLLLPPVLACHSQVAAPAQCAAPSSVPVTAGSGSWTSTHTCAWGQVQMSMVKHVTIMVGSQTKGSIL